MKEMPSNFIHDIIDHDLENGINTVVHTRFPPEPNGYLHIGHMKSIWFNYGTAKKYGGKFNLRYDDTNPTKEDTEYVDSIYNDLLWLGTVPDNVCYGSDYFQQCYDFAVKLIKDGKAFVCDLTADELREYRGTLTEPGKESPYRNRSIEENLDLFERMKNGEFPNGARTLRAKIDMSSPNIYMRDPAIFRILHTDHFRQGDKWCIYPLYDYAHPLQDAIEGITYSTCAVEFENNRPLYNWFVDNVGGFDLKPRQIEFGKMFISNTVMGKRYLRKLVETNVVDGWDDPRLPTVCALRRRGFTPDSIFDFISRAGLSKAQSLIELGMLDHCIREELNEKAPRRIAVLEPIKVVITNYPEDKVEYFSISNNPNNPDAGIRELPFTRELYIERSDFEEVPPPKYFRLKPDGEVRLMGAYIIKCNDIIKDDDGNIVEIYCSYDPDTGGKNPPDGRKIKGTIHWVSSDYAIDSDVVLYDKLFTIENTNDIPEDKTYDDYLNPDSVIKLTNCKLESSLKDVTSDTRYQFVRNGYFIKDTKFENTFNRIVTLKDSYKK